MPDSLTIASGAQVSSAYFFQRPYRLAIQVPSLTATEVRVQFAATSGASGTGDFWADLARYDGTGIPWSAYSGSGPAFTYLAFAPPTPFLRLSVTVSQTNVRSFLVFPVAGYR